MPDVWSTIADADVAMQERLASVLDEVESDPIAQATLESFLSLIDFPADSRVLEIGCGTGRVVRALARRKGVAQLVGVDPSPVLIDKAGELTGSASNVSFEIMGRKLDFQADQFDVVMTYRTLMHIPGPEQVLAESLRVLRPGGVLALLEADAAGSTVAVGEHDPLQDCLAAAMTAFLNDAWLVRRLPLLLKGAGFDLLDSRCYGDLRTSQPGVVLSQIDRGADTLASWGRITPQLASALKAEARQRIEDGRFYAFVGEVAFIAKKAG
jgi:ubiquinone/menaquinone biosynthesis C-methylase UbiE